MSEIMPGAKTVDSVIKDLVNHGKTSGHISTNEILEAMGEMDFDPER